MSTVSVLNQRLNSRPHGRPKPIRRGAPESQAKMAMEAMEAELGPAGMKAHGGAKGRLTAVRMRWIKARNAALIAHGQSPVEVPVL